MTTPQSAILPDHSRAAVFMEADTQANPDELAAACLRALSALADLQTAYPQAQLGLTIGFGADCWQRFGHTGEGADIKPFRPLGNGLAPATQHDLLLHIQSQRHDVNMALAMAVVAAFDGLMTVAGETHGFRWVEDRGLEGFVDGTENPQGEQNIRRVGVIGEGAVDAGGRARQLADAFQPVWERSRIVTEYRVLGV